MFLKRRRFIKQSVLSSLALGTSYFLHHYLINKRRSYNFNGAIVGANYKLGHLLNQKHNILSYATKEIDTIIVGGGISGMSAAWWLNKNNKTDFILLEMDKELGGNSVSNENSVSKYPWGAHYVTLPSEESSYVRLLFEEIGIITGYQKGLPIYNEFYLCAAPQERLFFQGKWQEGLVPLIGIQEEDKRQYKNFFHFISELKYLKGLDQKPLFCIPLENSSQNNEYIKLDKISMKEFMLSNGWTSKYLNWYVNYCCRDDYGRSYEKVSAWAGIHFFVSRVGFAANADSNSVLTWPEGNGFLVNYLKKYSQRQIKKNSLVVSVENMEKNCSLIVFDTKEHKYTQYNCRNVIYSAPRYTADKVIKNYHSNNLPEYSPWLVANITVKNFPLNGDYLAWDNVNFYSKSLGYIVANHQDLRTMQKEIVLTYYLPLDEKEPWEERKQAYKRSYQDWLDIIILDLEMTHKDFSKYIIQLDVWIWGHGMSSPGINFLWSDKRKNLLKPFGNIFFAHSDMSGISIFEEAQYRGIEAAKSVISRNKL